MSQDFSPFFPVELLEQSNFKASHGKLAQIYSEVLASLPQVKTDHFFFDRETGAICIGDKEELNQTQHQNLVSALREFIPWKKGPYRFFGHRIDAEWRSDWKWKRILPHLPDLNHKTVLDIGPNNGYFMFCSHLLGAKNVLGVDPVLHCSYQFKLAKHFLNTDRLHFELLGVEHLDQLKQKMDLIFYMGISYHHKNPIQHLIDLKSTLSKTGTLIFETIGIDGPEHYCLFPPDRYANMRNVWFIPTKSVLFSWLTKAKFKEIELISETRTTVEEQRNTEWCPRPQQTLADFLDPNDSTKTIEGHPGPVRYIFRARP